MVQHWSKRPSPGTSAARHITAFEREIQTRFRYDSQKKGYDRLTPLDVLSVTASGGASAQYTVKKSGDLENIRIGDPDRTITGEHTYTIRYRLRGVLNHFKDHDELYLNVIGTDFNVPIDRATASVRVPWHDHGRGLLHRPAGIAACRAQRPRSRVRPQRSASRTSPHSPA